MLCHQFSNERADVRGGGGGGAGGGGTTSLFYYIKVIIISQCPLAELKVMTNHVFSIMTNFQIWACQVKTIERLFKIFVLPDMLLNLDWYPD